MDSGSRRYSLKKTVIGIFLVLSTSSLITFVLYLFHGPTAERRVDPLLGDLGSSITSIFTSDYPASSRFKEELNQMRSTGRLKSEHEVLINRWIVASSEALEMPSSILWCLLFQESRLNHLQGIESNRSSSGLGQFSYYSFYEVNHHLDKFTKNNLVMLTSLLGKDIRPIEARKTDVHHPSSYYFIPTAVAASASYLNNRYHHIASLLEKHKIPYDPQLLWFYAAMAYNKGTRSVLSFWNEARRKGGAGKVEKLLLENDAFHDSIQDNNTISKSLKKIWSDEDTLKYAKELKIHMANLKDCVLAPEEERTEVKRIKRKD